MPCTGQSTSGAALAGVLPVKADVRLLMSVRVYLFITAGAFLLSAFPTKAADNYSIDRLAYEVYVGCYNQYLWSLARSSTETQALVSELEGCRQLARHVLAASKTQEAVRYAAYLLLLGTDGGESEQNNELLHSKRTRAKRYIQEVRELLASGRCLPPPTNVENPAPRLCADAITVERRIESWLK